MAMLRTCRAPGCGSLTFGELCAAHEELPEFREWPRGRPYASDVAPADALDTGVVADVSAHVHEQTSLERVHVG